MGGKSVLLGSGRRIDNLNNVQAESLQLFARRNNTVQFKWHSRRPTREEVRKNASIMQASFSCSQSVKSDFLTQDEV
jgi:hypothetical protein